MKFSREHPFGYGPRIITYDSPGKDVVDKLNDLSQCQYHKSRHYNWQFYNGKIANEAAQILLKNGFEDISLKR